MTKKRPPKADDTLPDEIAIDPMAAATDEESETATRFDSQSESPSDMPAEESAKHADLPPFCVGNAPVKSNEVFPALDRINQRFAKRLRMLFEPIVRSRLAIEVYSVEMLDYGTWQARQGDYACMTIFALKPLEGKAILMMDQCSIERYVDLYYGGEGSLAVCAKGLRELSPAEDHFAGRFGVAKVGALGEIWSDLIEVEPQVIGREMRVAFANPVSAEEDVLICRFRMTGGSLEQDDIVLLYPVTMLRHANALLTQGENSLDSAENDVWQHALAEAASNIMFKARTVIARPELPLSRLLALAPGDSIPFTTAAHVPLIIGDRVVAMGTLGEQSGQAAFKVDRLEQGKVAQ